MVDGFFHYWTGPTTDINTNVPYYANRWYKIEIFATQTQTSVRVNDVWVVQDLANAYLLNSYFSQLIYYTDHVQGTIPYSFYVDDIFLANQSDMITSGKPLNTFNEKLPLYIDGNYHIMESNLVNNIQKVEIQYQYNFSELIPQALKSIQIQYRINISSGAPGIRSRISLYNYTKNGWEIGFNSITSSGYSYDFTLKKNLFQFFNPDGRLIIKLEVENNSRSVSKYKVFLDQLLVSPSNYFQYRENEFDSWTLASCSRPAAPTRTRLWISILSQGGMGDSGRTGSTAGGDPPETQTGTVWDTNTQDGTYWYTQQTTDNVINCMGIDFTNGEPEYQFYAVAINAYLRVYSMFNANGAISCSNRTSLPIRGSNQYSNVIQSVPRDNAWYSYSNIEIFSDVPIDYENSLLGGYWPTTFRFLFWRYQLDLFDDTSAYIDLANMQFEFYKYAPSGNATSPVYVIGDSTNAYKKLYNITYNAFEPGGSDAILLYRILNPYGRWTSWAPIGSGEPINALASQVQLRFFLKREPNRGQMTPKIVAPVIINYDSPDIPNIIEVNQTPITPSYQQNVNVTTRITHTFPLRRVYIETNSTGSGFQNLTMTLLSSKVQDGLNTTIWSFLYTNYLSNATISYRIFARDIGNTCNKTNYFHFSYFDEEKPNLMNFIRDPSSYWIPYTKFVNVTLHVTDKSPIQSVYIRTNTSGSLANYSMTQLSGNSRDGIWNYTFTSYPTNLVIFYQVYAKDALGNFNQTPPDNFFTDTLGSNIVTVDQTPLIPSFEESVAITAHVIDQTQIQWIYIETNHTGTFYNYSMTLQSGSSQDGVWSFTFTSYPENQTIIYRIYSCDIFGNLNQTNQYSFGYFDKDKPNIVDVVRNPTSNWIFSETLVNVSIHITDKSPIQMVYITTNISGSLMNYAMIQSSGSLTDGVWNYTFTSYPANMLIFYQMFAQDALGNLNQTLPYVFYSDSLGPNIISVIQNPEVPSYLSIVNVTAHITEYAQILSVQIESNHTGVILIYTMTHLSGDTLDGFWRFTFNSYPLNRIINYRIITKDIIGNVNNTNQLSFGVFDLSIPTITNINQVPLTLTTENDTVTIRARVLENFAIKTVNGVLIEHNRTGTFENESMNRWSGDLQDGIWEITFSDYPINQSILYRIFAIDIVNNNAVTTFRTFGLFPIIKWSVPTQLEVQINIDETKVCIIIFSFRNTGTTALLNLNFTLINIPLDWAPTIGSQMVARLDPNNQISIELRLTAPNDVKNLQFSSTIGFEAIDLATGEEYTDTVLILITTTKKSNDFTIWIIIIVGSAAAAIASTYLIRRSRMSKGESRPKPRSKGLENLKAKITKDFPGFFSTIPLELIDKINSIKSITDSEKELVIQYISQLDEEEAYNWLNEFIRIQPN